MKANIHPKYVDAIVRCACGETFKTRSTKPEIHLEICSKCHPFFTGKQKLVDTAGRVHELLFAGKERMAFRADFQVDFRLCGAGLERLAASASYYGVDVFG